MIGLHLLRGTAEGMEPKVFMLPSRNIWDDFALFLCIEQGGGTQCHRAHTIALLNFITWPSTPTPLLLRHMAKGIISPLTN